MKSTGQVWGNSRAKQRQHKEAKQSNVASRKGRCVSVTKKDKQKEKPKKPKALAAK